MPGDASGPFGLGTDYFLLGPMLVRRDGAEVRIPAGQQRVLLAALLLRPGRPVSADELAGLLWPETAPASVRLSVQNAVMRLRRTLGDSAAALATVPEGYLLRAGPEELDVTRFAAGVAAGQAAARAGRWAQAAGQLRAALALWRGEPLSGVACDALAARELPRLAELRLQALEARIDADLHLGRAAEVISELRQLAAAEPLRERLHGLLMLALYRDGQQAAALAAYQAAREMLIEELGTGPDLRALHQRILAHDPALASDPALAAPGASPPAPGAEPEPPEVRYSLPPGTAAFTGRLGELDRITGAVAGSSGPGRVVAIRAIGGMPGVGKTTLAVHAARLLRDRFPDRQLFVDLRGHTPGQDPVSPADALAGLLAAAGVDPRFMPGDLTGRTALWRDKMTGQRAILVLDNAASSAQVTPLLPGGDSCLVLVTSRRHLADLPGPVVQVQLDVLPPQEARQMLLRLAQREPAGPAEAAAVAELTELAGRLPLAITLLARLLGRHPSWTLADLVTEVTQTRASLLSMAAEEDSVAAALEVSYRHLGDAEQRFLRTLGLHPGSTADRYAAAALAGVPLGDAAALLDRLHREGLLTETGYRRYGMHDLIRQYAAGRAAADPPAARAAAVGRLLDYYTATAARAQELISGRPRPAVGPAAAGPAADGPELPDAQRALAWSKTELPGMLAGLDHAARTGARDRVVALTAALTAVLAREGPRPEAIARHAAAAAAAADLGDRPGRAGALTELAATWAQTGRYADARQALAQAGDLWAVLGDRAGQARVAFVTGKVLLSTGDLPGAAAMMADALAAYRELGHRASEAEVLAEIADVNLTGGDYADADLALARALDLYTELGDRGGQAAVLTGIAAARRLTGDLRDAARALEQALAITRDLGDRLRHASALFRLGAVRLATGDYPAALRVQEEALASYRELGSTQGVLITLISVGDTLRWCGDYAAAARSLEDGLDLARRTQTRQSEANALLYLGVIRRLSGDLTAAAECLDGALAIYDEMGDRGGAAEALNENGVLYVALGRPDRARGCHEEALRLGRELSSAFDEARAEAGLARCDLAGGDGAAAAARLRRAQRIFEQAGCADARVAAELDALAPSAAGGG